MQSKKIREICKLAHQIDLRINLFEGYFSKMSNNYNGELLFWRQIVTIYGLLADCDRFQIKDKKNMFDLMYRYDLIDQSDYEKALVFWTDISEFRKWFCHNNDENLYYPQQRMQYIKKYLNKTFLIASNKPESIKDIKDKDWDKLVCDVDRRFQVYLDTLKSGLCEWQSSCDKDDLIDEWIQILANSLFLNKELIHNVLAELARYKKKDENINNMTVSQLENSYFNMLDEGGFCKQNIIDELKKSNTIIKTNWEILRDSIQNSHIIY